MSITSPQHIAAVETYKANRGRAARRSKALARIIANDPVTVYICGHRHGSKQAGRCSK